MNITRTVFQNACNAVDDIAGTMSVSRCIEQDAARLFPTDDFMAYLDWLHDLITEDLPCEDMTPAQRYESAVNDVLEVLEPDSTLYLEDYRTYLDTDKQILFAINRHFGMAWIHAPHVKEARKRRRSTWHE